MSVPYLREAAAQDDLGKLIRFVRLHLGDGNETVGKEEIDRSWAEAAKTLLRDAPVDREFIARVLERDESTLALLFFHLHFISSASPEGGFMTAADKSVFASAIDPREAGTQLRPGLWQTINERYPGSMIRKENFVPQAHLTKPLAASRLTVVSSCGVHLKTDQPLDVCHPFGADLAPPGEPPLVADG